MFTANTETFDEMIKVQNASQIVTGFISEGICGNVNSCCVFPMQMK